MFALFKLIIHGWALLLHETKILNIPIFYFNNNIYKCISFQYNIQLNVHFKKKTMCPSRIGYYKFNVYIDNNTYIYFCLKMLTSILHYVCIFV